MKRRPPSFDLFETPDGGTEPYLINPRPKSRRRSNPPLIIVNPKRGKKPMAGRTIQMTRNRYGQFVAKKRNSPARKRKNTPARRKTTARASTRSRSTAKRRSNPPPFWTAGVVTNRKRAKRRTRKNPASISLSRQGKIAGVPVPALSDVGYISMGLAGPPLVKGAALKFIPTSWTVTQAGMYAVEGIGYAVPPIVGYMVGGTRAVRLVVAGEAAGLVVRLVSRWTGQGLGRLPSHYRGSPGVRGYLAPTTSASLRGYLAPTTQTALRAFPRRSPGSMSSTRTRSHSRYR